MLALLRWETSVTPQKDWQMAGGGGGVRFGGS